MGRRSRVACALPLLLAAAACGGRDTARDAVPGRLDGPPLLEATRVALPPGARGMNVRAQAPCRLVLSVEGLPGGTRTYPPHRLAAGQDTRLWWAERLGSAARATGTPPAEAAAEGRTLGVEPRLRFAFEDFAVITALATVYVRPGTPEQAVRDYLPPARPGPLPFGARIELCTFAFGDLPAGEHLRILPDPTRNRVRPAPGADGPGLRVHVLRLWLRAERAE